MELKKYIDMSSIDKLINVNKDINSLIRYKQDVVDTWNTPKETLKLKCGDCEDYAILKLSILLDLGFKTDNLKLIYCFLKTGTLREAHIVLEVTLDNKEYILDNALTSVLTLKERTDLEVVFKFNKNNLWVNGVKTEHDPKKRIGQWGKVVERSIKEKSNIG